MRAERWWRRAVEVSEQALAAGALVPLETRLIDQPAIAPFLLRELVSRPPRHLRPEGPKPNPFLPWDQPLEVGHIGESHVLLLNKYPVQACHLLVITRGWQPQSGWLDATDWASVAAVGADTGGLWFFNSGATAGASQPHRHLQLLPRSEGAPAAPSRPCWSPSCREHRLPGHGPTASAPALIPSVAEISRSSTRAIARPWALVTGSPMRLRAIPTTCCSTTAGSSRCTAGVSMGLVSV